MTTKISSDVIQSGAITTAQIDSVATSKLTGTITTAQIADGQITEAKLSAGAGSANQVLKTNGSGTLSWIDQSSGYWEVLAEGTTTSPTYVSTLSFTGLGGYKFIRFIGNIKGNTTATAQLQMRFSYNNGASYDATANSYHNGGGFSGVAYTSVRQLYSQYQTAFRINWDQNASGYQEFGNYHAGGYMMDLLIHQKQYPTFHMKIGPAGNSNWAITDGPCMTLDCSGIHNNTGTPNAFQLINIANGLGLLSYTILGAQ